MTGFDKWKIREERMTNKLGSRRFNGWNLREWDGMDDEKQN